MARPIAFDETTIIRQVQDLFWLKGYHNTSTQDIIDATGLSKSSLYNSFGDKKQLFTRVLSQYQQESYNYFVKLLSHDDTSAYAQIEKVLHIVADSSVCDCSQKGCFLLNTAIELAPHDPELCAFINNHRQKMVSLFSKTIQKGIDSGELSQKINPETVGQFIFTVINGIKADGKVTRDKAVFLQSIDTALSVLM